MLNPIETAQKILKGCNGRMKRLYLNEMPYCGINHRFCKTCKATLFAKKEEWQNEIIDNVCEQEYLSWIIGFLGTDVYTKPAFEITKERLENTIKKYQSLKKAVELANG